MNKRQEGAEDMLSALKKLSRAVEYVEKRARQYEETQKVLKRISGKNVNVSLTDKQHKHKTQTQDTESKTKT